MHKSETGSYGIVKVEDFDHGLLKVKAIVEKPDPADAPSNIAVVGRYILSPGIMNCLENVKLGKGGEIQLTDAISSLLSEEDVLAYQYHGKRYDCGSKLGYMQANVEYGLVHPEISAKFSKWLATRTQG